MKIKLINIKFDESHSDYYINYINTHFNGVEEYNVINESDAEYKIETPQLDAEIWVLKEWCEVLNENNN